MRADEDYVVSLWQHEVQRVVGDRISRSDDSTWFERKVKDLTKTVSSLFRYFKVNKYKIKHNVQNRLIKL